MPTYVHLIFFLFSAVLPLRNLPDINYHPIQMTPPSTSQTKQSSSRATNKKNIEKGEREIEIENFSLSLGVC